MWDIVFAASVMSGCQAPPLTDRSTRNSCSVVLLSAQVSDTVLVDVAFAESPVGAAGTASVVALSVFDGWEHSSAPRQARTRYSYIWPPLSPVSEWDVALAAAVVRVLHGPAPPCRRSIRKPVSVVLLSFQARPISVADTAVAVRPDGAGRWVVAATPAVYAEQPSALHERTRYVYSVSGLRPSSVCPVLPAPGWAMSA